MPAQITKTSWPCLENNKSIEQRSHVTKTSFSVRNVRKTLSERDDREYKVTYSFSLVKVYPLKAFNFNQRQLSRMRNPRSSHIYNNSHSIDPSCLRNERKMSHPPAQIHIHIRKSVDHLLSLSSHRLPPSFVYVQLVVVVVVVVRRTGIILDSTVSVARRATICKPQRECEWPKSQQRQCRSRKSIVIHDEYKAAQQCRSTDRWPNNLASLCARDVICVQCAVDIFFFFQLALFVCARERE